MPELSLITNLAVALAVGLLIGLERGWKDRTDPDGSRVAGFRTIGLIGLLGGLAMLLDGGKGFVLAAGFLGLALLLNEGFEAQIGATREVSATTMVGALTAYVLGAVAVNGHPQLAAMCGVATTLILWLRVPFHGLLHRIEPGELNAFLYWLVITIIILPILPDRQLGPYDALNPQTIWLMVVLISGLGFAGYVSMKWFGSRRGAAVLAISGGLVSSTATTVAFAQLSRKDKAVVETMLAGVATAWAIMFARTFVVIALLAPSMLLSATIPLVAMLVACLIQAALLYRRSRAETVPEINLSNPLDLWSAGVFTLVLTAGMLASKAAANLFGGLGLYIVSIIAGAVDIEAVSLSITQIVGRDVPVDIAAAAVTLAAISNTLFKGILAASAGSDKFRAQSIRLALVTALCGGAALAWTML